jgi:hypothetical protein
MAGVILCLAGAVAAESEEVLSLSGFGPVKFGTSLKAARRVLTGARRVKGDLASETALEPARPVMVAGRQFRVRLRFFADRLQEVVYRPRRRCPRDCLRRVRLALEARLGKKPELLGDESEVKTWLWPELDRDKPWIVVMIHFEAGRLIEISVSDQSEQQILHAFFVLRGVAKR